MADTTAGPPKQGSELMHGPEPEIHRERPSGPINPWPRPVPFRHTLRKDTAMSELLVDFITSLNGHTSRKGWPGSGLQGRAWLGSASSPRSLPHRSEHLPPHVGSPRRGPGGPRRVQARKERRPSTSPRRRPRWCTPPWLEEPLTGPTPRLVRGDPVEAVPAMKEDGSGSSARRQPRPVPVTATGGRRPLPGSGCPPSSPGPRAQNASTTAPQRRPSR